MAKLDDGKIRWLIREKSRGMRTGEVALVQGLTPRPVRQLWHACRHGGAIPVLKKPGGPRKEPISPKSSSSLKPTIGSGLML